MTKSKAITYSLLCCTILISLPFGLCLYRIAQESYFICKLHSHSVAIRRLAAEKLKSIGSSRSFPSLLEVLASAQDDFFLRPAYGLSSLTNKISWDGRESGKSFWDTPSESTNAEVTEIEVYETAFEALSNNTSKRALHLLLLQILLDTRMNAKVRALVARTVGAKAAEFGKLTAESIAALTQTLKDVQWIVRAYSANALWEIGPPAKDALKTLREMLKDENRFVRIAATQALGSIGGSAEVMDLLESSDTFIRYAAVESLCQLGSEARKALPKLVHTLVYNDPGLRISVLEVLGKLGGEAEEAVPSIVLMLKEQKYVQIEAINALANIGRVAAAAVPDLKKLQADKDRTISESATKALEVIEK